MNIVTRQLRMGFVCIGILFLLIILVVVLAVLANCATPDAPNAQRTGEANQVSGTAQAVKESAQAGRAVIRLAGEAEVDPPAAVTPTADAPAVDPAPGSDDGLDSIFDGFFDGL